ncbi:MAG: flagellar hook-basal body complex protein, partial [Oscillospiraceae bacterium]
MGMKAHQSKLDVIGNNIANVSTYGFKSSRATFKDVYYSTISGASGATADRGGKNPTQVGYGSSLNSIDVVHGQQGVQMTDRGLDAAITGEGFFQVKDPDGNIFYTRAGILNYDEAGNLIDSNGNFVLGVSGNPLGKAPGTEKIQFNIPAVDPTAAKVKEKINGINFTISAQNSVSAGNVKMQFISTGDLPLGQDCAAEMNSSNILIKLNKGTKFNSISELETAVNNAITEANGGQTHPAGKFSILMEGTFPTGGLSGEQIASKDFTPQLGKVDIPTGSIKYNNGSADVPIGIDFVSAGSDFKPDIDEKLEFSVAKTDDGWVIKAGDYEGTIPSTATTAGEIILKSPTKGSFTVTHPGFDALEKAARAANGIADDAEVPATTVITLSGNADIATVATTDSKALGLSSKDFLLTGGTEGGAQG